MLQSAPSVTLEDDVVDSLLFFPSKAGGEEPRSVLENLISPSSPASTSNRSSPDNLGATAVHPWPPELNPIPAPLGGFEGSDSTLFSWILPDSSPGARLEGSQDLGLEILDPGIGFEYLGGAFSGQGSLIPMIPPPPFSGYLNNTLKSPAIVSSNSFFNTEFPMPQPNLSIPNESITNLLFKAAELLESGNTVSAHRILARLNHHLPSPSGDPLIRSAFYFKEALFAIYGEQCCRPPSSPLETILKLSSCKIFAEISPVSQFLSFTSAQAVFEELAGAVRIHILDFDIGVGCRWPPLIHELSERRSAAAGQPFQLLRITAFVSPASHCPLELSLIQENLADFASILNVPFELNFLPLESFDPSAALCSSGESVAVNLAAGFCHHQLPIQTLLRLIKRLSPNILIAAGLCCDGNADLSFSRHVLQSLQSCTALLDSIEASGASSEVTDMIERYSLRPRIESSVLGRFRTGVKLIPWQSLFASAGFVPVQCSSFAEAQADCLLRKVQVKGFMVEKRQSSLMLSWQRGDIAAVSVWR